MYALIHIFALMHYNKIHVTWKSCLYVFNLYLFFKVKSLTMHNSRGASISLMFFDYTEAFISLMFFNYREAFISLMFFNYREVSISFMLKKIRYMKPPLQFWIGWDFVFGMHDEWSLYIIFIRFNNAKISNIISNHFSLSIMHSFSYFYIL